MKLAILGYAREGRAAYDHWKDKGYQITICDQNSDVQVPEGVSTHLGPDYLKGLDAFDVIVRTAGLHPRLIAEANPEAPHILDKVTSSVNEFLHACPTQHIVGVTGTKGKGTTCTLLAKILESAGRRVHLGGNIGIAPLEMLKQKITPDDWVILELSSFQLMDLKVSPPIAVCLAVVAEHLNWHADMGEYTTAKLQLFKHQQPEDIAIYCAGNQQSQTITAASPGHRIPYLQPPGAEVKDDKIVIDGQTICTLADIKLVGRHHWQNVCAAVTAAWQVTQDVSAIRQAIIDFTGLPHRMQLVRELDGVQYYDDSFSSAPDATIAALEALEQPKILITGGVDKQLNLDELAQTIHQHQSDLRHVLIIGEIAPRLEAALQATGFTNYEVLTAKQLGPIFAAAKQVAQAGDAVIFSPGSSSFDMFKDISDRGQQTLKHLQAL